MKISSNKKKGNSVKSSGIVEKKISEANDERYSVQKISNGYITEKSWTDKNGAYQCVKTYSEKNPIDNEASEKE
ncbi:MAG TPA: hypothetical protein VL443_24390 [Cyclobacteriaceae bacterium]|jgi:hypothetical protein|nr:hypothetical protein [Cyclobacteriaceae bacterium]